MTTIVAQSHLGPATGVGAFRRRLMLAVAGLRASLRRRRQARVHQALLDSLDDRTLDDIGVVRAQTRDLSLLTAPRRVADTMRRVIEECARPA